MLEHLLTTYSVAELTSLKSMLSVTVAAVIAWTFYALVLEKSKRLIDKIPGYKDWPLIGDVLHFKRDPIGKLYYFCFLPLSLLLFVTTYYLCYILKDFFLKCCDSMVLQMYVQCRMSVSYQAVT